ncbi:MAG: hypothetical protein NTV19_05700 [Burkholderiales bacterium]|nr:hypothetical protein [Burkholderiales bacterium]
MSEIVPAPQTPPPGAVPPTFGRDPRDESLRRICLLDYGLHIGGLILSAGLLSVVALILNYLKRDDAAGTIYQSHMNWMIRTFWWTLFWMAALFLPTLLLTLFTFGFLGWMFLLPGLWFLYRMVRGLLRLLEDRPAG